MTHHQHATPHNARRSPSQLQELQRSAYSALLTGISGNGTLPESIRLAPEPVRRGGDVLGRTRTAVTAQVRA